MHKKVTMNNALILHYFTMQTKVYYFSEIAKRERIVFNLKKLQLGKSVRFLGKIVSKDGIKIDEDQLLTLREFEIKNKVCQF